MFLISWSSSMGLSFIEIPSIYSVMSNCLVVGWLYGSCIIHVCFSSKCCTHLFYTELNSRRNSSFNCLRYVLVLMLVLSLGLVLRPFCESFSGKPLVRCSL
uniref:Uncharacterized protein n=1 Tax=Octopus bimaculoides TaxID=37653 RepID=A0A0L8GNI2_OCTBM